MCCLLESREVGGSRRFPDCLGLEVDSSHPRIRECRPADGRRSVEIAKPLEMSLVSGERRTKAGRRSLLAASWQLDNGLGQTLIERDVPIVVGLLGEKMPREFRTICGASLPRCWEFTSPVSSRPRG